MITKLRLDIANTDIFPSQDSNGLLLCRFNFQYHYPLPGNHNFVKTKIHPRCQATPHPASSQGFVALFCSRRLELRTDDRVVVVLNAPKHIGGVLLVQRGSIGQS